MLDDNIIRLSISYQNYYYLKNRFTNKRQILYTTYLPYNNDVETLYTVVENIKYEFYLYFI